MASFATERLVTHLTRDENVAQRWQSDPDRLMDEYAVPQSEREALQSGDPAQLAGIELHPILQIHYVIGTQHPMAGGLNGSLMDRLRENPDG